MALALHSVKDCLWAPWVLSMPKDEWEEVPRSLTVQSEMVA